MKLKLFNRKRETRSITIDRSMGYIGPAKPHVKTVTTTMECQYIRFKNGETGALVGPWINNWKWDGSYIVIHSDSTIGYYFPAAFSWTGFTIGEAIEAANIKKKWSQKEKEQVAS